MWWRPQVIKWTILSIGIGMMIVTILTTLMLLPSLTDGPDSVHYLERSVCTIRNITYLDNFCPRDTSTDFSNLIYRNDWNVCKIISFDIITDNEQICKWYFPGSYSTEEEAYIAVSEDFKIDLKYDCVIDVIKNICYPDKNEILIFGLSVGSLSFITIIIFIIYFVVRIRFNKKKK